MQIYSNYPSQSFNANVKLRKPNVNRFKEAVNSSLCTAAGVGSGLAITDTALSYLGHTPTVATPESVNLGKDILFSVGAENGVPAQSTILPSGLASSGIGCLKEGIKSAEKVIPD